LQVLSEFLQAGLAIDEARLAGPNTLAVEFPLWRSNSLAIPTKSNAYAYLGLFGAQQDDEKQILDDRNDRLRVFNGHFRSLVLAGIDAAKKEGGELGRASGLLVKALDRAQPT
jgi:pre-rRNA-processing protein IPI1